METPVAQVFEFPKKSGVAGSANTNGTPQLKLGSVGLAVKEVQLRLQQLQFELDINSSFDAATKAAVEAFQLKNSLQVDGIVGVNTWKKLEAQTSDPLAPMVDDRGNQAPAAPMPNPVTAPVAGKPLWQWGLIAAGVAVVGYVFWKSATEKSSSVSGYRTLLSDENPKSRPSKSTVEGKCRRTPGNDKLKDAEELEVA